MMTWALRWIKNKYTFPLRAAFSHETRQASGATAPLIRAWVEGDDEIQVPLKK
jgi:hypothetical protein